VIIITGSGRSGTSAVARLLHESGISVGRDLIEADRGNTEGYFEERAVVAMNERLLAGAGLHEWFATVSRERMLEIAEGHREEMRALAATATPAWKDPRFCWTLEAWLRHFDEKPRILVCLRSPEEVIASTTEYFGLASDEAKRAAAHVWRAEYERLIEIIDAHGLDATCVEYDALLGDTERTIGGLSSWLGRPIDASGLRRHLRHHARAVPDEYLPLYERVRGLGYGHVA